MADAWFVSASMQILSCFRGWLRSTKFRHRARVTHSLTSIEAERKARGCVAVSALWILEMAQLFRPGANSVAIAVIVAAAFSPVAAVGLTYALWLSPYATRQNVMPRQPVPFSHEHHVGRLGIDCRYCHTGVEAAAFAGLPPTHTCMTCHSQLYTDAPMLELVRSSMADKIPIHWVRVNRVPDYVYFDHSIHIAKGVGCTTCHGAVGTMPLMRQAEPLTMGWCLNCHRDPAKYVRPRERVFDPDWIPPENQAEQGARLVSQYLIKTRGLTDCSRCHR